MELGRGLGMGTLAEGWRRRASSRQLELMGCELGQGYLFAPPLEVAALERLLADQTGRAAYAGLIPRRLLDALLISQVQCVAASRTSADEV